MYDRLREWFDTFESDPFTVAVVGALVDCSESLKGLIDSSPFVPEDMPPHGEEAAQALDDLETALDDTVKLT